MSRAQYHVCATLLHSGAHVVVCACSYTFSICADNTCVRVCVYVCVRVCVYVCVRVCACVCV